MNTEFRKCYYVLPHGRSLAITYLTQTRGWVSVCCRSTLPVVGPARLAFRPLFPSLPATGERRTGKPQSGNYAQTLLTILREVFQCTAD